MAKAIIMDSRHDNKPPTRSIKLTGDSLSFTIVCEQPSP